MDRIIETGLTTQLQADIIDAMFGQLSDGKWENSRAMEGYWPYIEVVKKGKNIFLVVSENMKFASRPLNKFEDMPDDKVKIWVANKIKEVIKDEGLDWDRGNREETEYLSTDWRKSKKAATVSDCYYVYEILKGRNAARHAEYNIKENTMRLSEAKEILKNNGYLLKEEYVKPKSTIDYWEEVKEIDPKALEQLEEDITEFVLDGGNIELNDYGQYVNMDDWDPSQPHDAVYESIFDAIGWDNDCFYNDLVDEFGTPEQYVKNL